jgi:hypothetical protein
MSSGAPREDGTPIRLPSVSLFTVSANDTYQTLSNGQIIEGPNPANAQIQPQRTMVSGYVKRIAMVEANIQWNVPNVNSNNNTMAFVSVDALGQNQQGFRIEVPPGFYTAPALAKAIQDLVNANPTFTGRFGANAMQISINGQIPTSGANGQTLSATNSCYFVFKVVDPLNPENLTNAGRIAIVPYQFTQGVPPPTRALVDDLLYMTGTTSVATTSTFPYWKIFVGSYASMQYTPYFDVCSNILTKNQTQQDASTTRGNNPSRLARIYLSDETISPRTVEATFNAQGAMIASYDSSTGCYAFTFRREFKFPKQIEWNTRQNIDAFDLRLSDYKGNLLPIQFRTIAIDENAEPTPDPAGEGYQNIDFADFQFTLQTSEV